MTTTPAESDQKLLKPNILVVDDEPMICGQLAAFFQEIGYKVSTVGNAADACSMLEQEPYDTILTDVLMPGEDGISLLGRVSQAWPDIPVILMTGGAQLEMAVEAIKNGAFDFVQKPFDFDYMAKIVERAVNYARLQRLEKNYRIELEQTVTRRTAELSASEERYHAIIEDQTELICRYLPDGRLSYVNGAYARYYNTSQGDLIDRNFIPNIPEPDMSMILERLAGITRDRPVAEYTHRIITPAGQSRWQHWTQRGIYSADGTLMEYQAVGYDVTESKLTEETLLFLLQCNSLKPGEDFFETLARYLAQTLNMDYICIDRLHGDGLTAQTVAVYHNGEFENNVEYTLKDTPCGDVVGKQICVFPTGVCNLFPKDEALQDLKAESYVGTTLWSFDMKPIGLIAVIGRQPLATPSLAESILKLVSIRAAAELERRVAEKSLLAINHKLENANYELTVLNDELEQRRSEAEENQNKMQQLLSMLARTESIAHIGSWEWDVATDNVTWSDEMFRIFKRNPADGAPSFEDHPNIYHPEDMAELKRVVALALRDRTPYEIELHAIRADGETRVCLARGYANGSPDGETTNLFGSLQDITERKQAENLLLEANQFIKEIINSAQEGVIVYGPDLRYQVWNPYMEHFSGLTAEDVLGRHPLELFPFLKESGVIERLEKALSGETPTPVDFPFTGPKTGISGWASDISAALRNTDGEIIGVIATVRDISESKQAEEKLRQAKADAEAANIAKSAFLANMSHEIRTPMNGVIGFAGVLLDSNLSKEQQEYAELIKKSGDNLLGLINDILDFSKIEAGKLDIELLDFDLRTTVEDTAEMLAMRAAGAGLELICRIDPIVPSNLKGDPGRLRQIITNLAGNAIKFTRNGEVVISAEVESDQGDSVMIRFSVSDTGIGIPEERRIAIFTPFTQVDGSTTRRYGGTGLGLAISKQLTEIMGGEIGVESEVSKGSTFWFTATFEKQTSSNQTSEVLKTSEVSEQVDITSARILVVNVNATNRTLMSTLLNSRGCRFETVSGAETALTLLREAAVQNDPFRIALLDQQMPGMDGYELGRRIKADPLIESILMIMVTSLGQRGDAAALKNIGFAGYLTKPIRQSQLYDCLALVLEKGNDITLNNEIVTRHTVAEHVNHGFRILLAEDNIINQKVAQALLHNLGYKVDVVANGHEAVQALELIHYDLVLLDCQMPEMDGFEATALIRDPSSKVLNHAVPIIALTANAMKKDRDECLAAGMDDYLSKPLKKAELAEVIGKWLKLEYEGK